MAGEQGNQPAAQTPPANPQGNDGQGTQQPQAQPSTEQKPQTFELDGETLTAEQIKELRTKAKGYDELRPKFTKVSQRLAELEEDDDYPPGNPNIPPTQSNNPNDIIAREVLNLKKTVGTLLESTEEAALEKRLGELKGNYKNMDEVEVLAALSVDPNIDIEEAARFSDKKNREKIDAIRAEIEAERQKNADGVLEGAGAPSANVPSPADPPTTIEDAGKRFLERLRQSKANQ